MFVNKVSDPQINYFSTFILSLVPYFFQLNSDLSNIGIEFKFLPSYCYCLS